VCSAEFDIEWVEDRWSAFLDAVSYPYKAEGQDDVFLFV
jgi:hypothetical protein